LQRAPSSACLEQLETFERLLSLLQAVFRILETKLPSPVPTAVYGRIYPRHTEQSAHQAALQKLARYLSGLKALLILLSHRMLQEDGVIKRTLDELGEDILFLVMQPENSDEVALRQRYLSAFYQEEFDESVSPIDSTRTRDQIRRKKIRAYLERRQTPAILNGKQAAGLVYQAYSGYVHAASPHLMEMCNFQSMKFDLSGVNDVDLFESHVADATNYFVRSLYSAAALASVLGEHKLYQELKARGDALAEV